ncbi:MAG: hypothetical protein KBS63_05300 [Clostridiales bacterium]|nr:hypothetical protein [Candidatus Crickella caballi]
MKKNKCVIAFMIALICVLCFTSCGGSQEISFQGFKMNIPSAWKADKVTLSEEYAIYEKLNAKGHDYRLLLNDTYGLLPKCSEGMKEAGAFFKEVTEDDASYSDVSEPVAGKFAGKYDMHVLTCKYHAINPMEESGESVYPCKLVRIYMGDHDVEIEFCAAEGDFESFDEAIQTAVCE